MNFVNNGKKVCILTFCLLLKILKILNICLLHTSCRILKKFCLNNDILKLLSCQNFCVNDTQLLQGKQLCKMFYKQIFSSYCHNFELKKLNVIISCK